MAERLVSRAADIARMLQKKIDEEVKSIIDSCYERAEEILKENMEVLHKCAALLLEKERIDREEFEKLFAGEEQTVPEN